METMYGSEWNTTVTCCEKEALSVLLVSAALVGSYVLAQDYLSLVLANKDGTKGDDHVKKQSEPCDVVSDVGSEDDDDDNDGGGGGDAGSGEGEEDLPSDEGEEYVNPNNKSNAKKDPLDGADGAEEENGEEEEDDEVGGGEDDDESDDDDDDDDDDGGEEDEDEDEPGSEEEDEEEETLQPPKKRKKQN